MSLTNSRWYARRPNRRFTSYHEMFVANFIYERETKSSVCRESTTLTKAREQSENRSEAPPSSCLSTDSTLLRYLYIRVPDDLAPFHGFIANKCHKLFR